MKKLLNPKRSKMHVRVRDLLKALYPGFTIREEMRVETQSGDLPVDLSVQQMNLCIECHGVQHFEFNPHFHKAPEDYTAQKTRDRHKQQAIRAAGWAYMVIRYDEYERLTTGTLAKKILKAMKEKN